MDPQRRSSIVMLTVIGLPLGTGVLAAAMPGQEMRRNLYPDRAACERDYSPGQCEQHTGGSGTGAGFHGPYYFANRSVAEARSDPGLGRTGQIAATETSIRGGFGHFGHTMHAGG
jgi:hypothetical protein